MSKKKTGKIKGKKNKEKKKKTNFSELKNLFNRKAWVSGQMSGGWGGRVKSGKWVRPTPGQNLENFKIRPRS